MTTVKDVNESYGSPDFLEVPFDLYNILSIGKEMTILSHSDFNMFVGELSDFWNGLIDDSDYQVEYETMDPYYYEPSRLKVERLQSVLPLSEAEVDAVLELKEENNKYYVRFNQFKDAALGEISITLGGIGKGYANDIISKKLTDLGLTHGAIVGGASSNTTLGDRYGDTVWTWTLESPSVLSDYSFKIIRNGAYGMSTSGA
ncbi:MAG: FAD:protein FMN transferase [Firmicutes bacterium]|nr:FAD:protein FMN transferase [Bacillota bacterium]